MSRSGEAAPDEEAVDEFPDAIKKISAEKEYLPEQVLMQMKVPYFRKKMPQRTCGKEKM